MDFVLFLLMNVTLFIRPGELIPGLEGVPIYNILIVATLLTAIPRVLERLNPDTLREEPISVCMLGLMCAVPLSHLVRFDLWSARFHGLEFAKCVLYYYLLVAIVNTVPRLRTFLLALAVLTTISSVIALLDYYNVIEIASLEALEDWDYDPITGEQVKTPRLRSTGLFNDPNDLSAIVNIGIVCSFMFLTRKGQGMARYLSVVPLAILLTTLVMTQSRGGALALIGALGVWGASHFGMLKSGLLIGVVALIAIFFVGGRQTDIGGALSKGTAESRIELWSEGLSLLKGSPLFGIGAHSYADEVGLVAHNSFVHTLTELGIVGGPFFIGAFWLAGRSLWSLRKMQRLPFGELLGANSRELLPGIAAILCSYVVSMCSLSRAYTIPPYLVLGTVNVYCLQSRKLGLPSKVLFVPARYLELIVVSVAFLIGIYCFIAVSAR